MVDEMSGPYRVVVTYEDGLWLADIPDLAGAHTYARTLPALDRYIREVVVLADDLPDNAMPGLRLAYEYHTGDSELDSRAASVRQMRVESERLASRTAKATAEVARRLVTAGLSIRDTAALLTVSPQRVSQITSQG